mmetsp:Transcript_56269/g.174548  ORF Transcript_56269/g.174548 Transcript_56269/m.174548 type:complete len:240 (-) Transcript_56269:346-1065(-)
MAGARGRHEQERPQARRRGRRPHAEGEGDLGREGPRHLRRHHRAVQGDGHPGGGRVGEAPLQSGVCRRVLPERPRQRGRDRGGPWRRRPRPRGPDPAGRQHRGPGHLAHPHELDVLHGRVARRHLPQVRSPLPHLLGGRASDGGGRGHAQEDLDEGHLQLCGEPALDLDEPGAQGRLLPGGLHLRGQPHHRGGPRCRGQGGRPDHVGGGPRVPRQGDCLQPGKQEQHVQRHPGQAPLRG